MYIYVLHMKTYVHLWYLNQLFSERELFQTNVIEVTETQISHSIPFLFYENRAA